MNLRILKKLSKRAAPLILELGARRGGGSFQHFIGEAGDPGGASTSGHDRKHWSRNRSIHDNAFKGSIVYRPRRQHARYPFIHMWQPMLVWPGTPMVGWNSGYECPEWEERDAWAYLCDIVDDAVVEYREVPVEDDEWGFGYRMEPYAIERLRNPAAVLRKARALAEAGRG